MRSPSPQVLSSTPITALHPSPAHLTHLSPAFNRSVSKSRHHVVDVLSEYQERERASKAQISLVVVGMKQFSTHRNVLYFCCQVMLMREKVPLWATYSILLEVCPRELCTSEVLHKFLNLCCICGNKWLVNNHKRLDLLLWENLCELELAKNQNQCNYNYSSCE